MKFVSFVHLGEPGFGVEKNNEVFDLRPYYEDYSVSLSDIIRMDELPTEEDLIDLRPSFSFSDLTYLPVIPNPGKILCVGLNYEKHREETKRDQSLWPTIFTRFADSQVAHNQAIIKPKCSERFDYEGELAVIIGRSGRNIEHEDAMQYVAGFSCYNDASVRDWQRHTSQFTPGKNFPKTGGFGPGMVSASDITNYKKLTIETRLNGETVQSASLDQLIFDIPTIISYCSRFTPLSPGDVIVTGTPGGVGDRRDPPLYMKHGDIIEVEISDIGCLRNYVLSES